MTDTVINANSLSPDPAIAVKQVAQELEKHELADKKMYDKVNKMSHDGIKISEDVDVEDGEHTHIHIHDKVEEKKMYEQPLNVFAGLPAMMSGVGSNEGGLGNGMGLIGGLLIGALFAGGLGGGGLFGGRGAAGAAVASEVGFGVESVLNNQNLSTILGAVNTTRTEANQGTGAILSAVTSGNAQTIQQLFATGANLSNQICSETRSVLQGQFDLSRQIDQSFAANQIARAQDKFDSAQIAYAQTIQTNNQFAAVAAQACANQNALERQIAECCCELKEAVAGVTTARIQDELNECRLREAIAAGNGGNGQVINQIAVSLGAITQTLASLQTKLA